MGKLKIYMIWKISEKNVTTWNPKQLSLKNLQWNFLSFYKRPPIEKKNYKTVLTERTEKQKKQQNLWLTKFLRKC